MPHAGVAVEADHQAIGLCRASCEILHVAGVQHVEAAVGERDPLARPAAGESSSASSCGSRQTLLRPACVRRRGTGACSRSARISSRVTVATPIFSTSSPPAMFASRIAGVVVRPGGQGQAERRHHHVAGAGDVVDLPRPRREGSAAAVAWASAMPSLSSVTMPASRSSCSRNSAAAASASSVVAMVRPVASPASRRLGVMAEQP